MHSHMHYRIWLAASQFVKFACRVIPFYFLKSDQCVTTFRAPFLLFRFQCGTIYVAIPSSIYLMPFCNCLGPFDFRPVQFKPPCTLTPDSSDKPISGLCLYDPAWGFQNADRVCPCLRLDQGFHHKNLPDHPSGWGPSTLIFDLKQKSRHVSVSIWIWRTCNLFGHWLDLLLV